MNPRKFLSKAKFSFFISYLFYDLQQTVRIIISIYDRLVVHKYYLITQWFKTFFLV